MTPEIQKVFNSYGRVWELVGSSLVEGVEPQDKDYITFCPADKMYDFVDGLLTAGGEQGEYPMRERTNLARVKFKQDNVDVLITPCKEFSRRFIAASKLCQKLMVCNKLDRIDVHHAVLFGDTPEVEDTEVF